MLCFIPVPSETHPTTSSNAELRRTITPEWHLRRNDQTAIAVHCLRVLRIRLGRSMHAWSGRREQPRTRTLAVLTDSLYAPLNYSFRISAADCCTAPGSDFFQCYSSSMCELLFYNAGPVHSMSGKEKNEHKGPPHGRRRKRLNSGKGKGDRTPQTRKYTRRRIEARPEH